LRKKAESLLKRFVEGEPFPDAPKEIEILVRTLESKGQQRALGGQNIPPQQPILNGKRKMELNRDHIRILQLAAQWIGRDVDDITVSVHLRINVTKAKVLLRRLHGAGMLAPTGQGDYRLTQQGENYLVDKNLI